MSVFRPRLSLLLVAAAALAACGPDYNAVANRLREKTIKQDQEIASLRDQLASANATLQSLRQQAGPPLQTLPPDRLDQLFVASRLEIRSMTDSWDTGDGKGLNGFRVYIRMYTKDGQLMPASGTMTIEAFELPPAPAQPRRLGAWTFTPQEMKKSWYPGFGLDHFALNCPWAPPASPPTLQTITFKARFQDLLSGNILEAELSKKVKLPPPASAPG